MVSRVQESPTRCDRGRTCVRVLLWKGRVMWIYGSIREAHFKRWTIPALPFDWSSFDYLQKCIFYFSFFTRQMEHSEHFKNSLIVSQRCIPFASNITLLHFPSPFFLRWTRNSIVVSLHWFCYCVEHGLIIERHNIPAFLLDWFSFHSSQKYTFYFLFSREKFWIL